MHKDEDFDTDFQLATEEAFRIDAEPFAGPSAKPKPYETDGLPVDPILKWFDQHTATDDATTTRVQAVHAHYHIIGTWIAANLPRCPERTVALRKLLESKDAALRSARETRE